MQPKVTYQSRGHPHIQAAGMIKTRKGDLMVVKRPVDPYGVCDFCGSPTGASPLYQFGFEPKEGKRVWTPGEFCSYKCWKVGYVPSTRTLNWMRKYNK